MSEIEQNLGLEVSKTNIVKSIRSKYIFLSYAYFGSKIKLQKWIIGYK